ncbi:MAG: Phenylacetic acid catabolic protein [Acetobacteraceae bacterium]
MSNGDDIRYLAAGGRLTSPDNAPSRYRGEVMRQMAVLTDSLLAGAAGFADCINLASGLRERITAARIVGEKFAHAERILGLMAQFGTNAAEYVSAHAWAARHDRSVSFGTRRIEGDMRLNVFHYPIEGWVDAIVLNTLMGQATVIQLDELVGSSYAPLADAVAEIRTGEAHHAERGRRGLGAILAQGHDEGHEEGHDDDRVQASVTYWYPRVADTFGRPDSERFETLKKLGLRHRSNQELWRQWRDEAATMLGTFGLRAPESGQ